MNKIINGIKNSNLQQVWDGSWGLLYGYEYGEFYLDLKFGKESFLKKVVFIIKNGKISAWFNKDDLKKSVRVLLDEVVEDPRIIKEWCDVLKKNTDIIMQFMNNNIGDIDFNIYEECLNKIKNEYYVEHLKIKYIVDALDAEKLEKYLPILEEARVYAEPVFGKTLDFDLAMVKQLAKKINFQDEKLLLHLSLSELKKVFKESKVSNKEELKQRNKFSALVFLDKNAKLFLDKDAKKLEEVLLDINNEDVIKGVVAYKGKVSGAVRIIFDPSKVKFFKDGDILVAGMTRPEYLPFIKKSAAFITDAGGVLSHAAITARELKKPCIIGTRVATNVLKDGDLVEVDADIGIIKKL